MVLALSWVAGCQESEQKKLTKPTPASLNTGEQLKANAQKKSIEGSHSVTCGCTLEHVGHCSEYVEVEGQYLQLVLPETTDLGKMPFCGKDNLKVSLKGELIDGKVIASQVEIQAKQSP